MQIQHKLGVVLTDWLSMHIALGVGSLPTCTRTLLVDTLGRLFAVAITSAGIDDGVAAPQLIEQITANCIEVEVADLAISVDVVVEVVPGLASARLPAIESLINCVVPATRSHESKSSSPMKSPTAARVIETDKKISYRPSPRMAFTATSTRHF